MARKHYKWQDDYKNSFDRTAILREFISAAVHVIHEDIMKNDKKLEDVLKSADSAARRISSTNCELIEGWKLHKTWFRCGFVQLALHGAKTSDFKESVDIKENVRFTYETLGWDFEEALRPKPTKVLTLQELDFFKGFDDDGCRMYGQFNTLMVPIAKFPEGSVYKSKHSGIEWELCEIINDDLFSMVAETKDKYENSKFREMKMSAKDLRKMDRVV